MSDAYAPIPAVCFLQALSISTWVVVMLLIDRKLFVP